MRRICAAATTVTVLALGAVGCGGDDGTKGASPTPPTTAASTPAQVAATKAAVTPKPKTGGFCKAVADLTGSRFDQGLMVLARDGLPTGAPAAAEKAFGVLLGVANSGSVDDSDPRLEAFFAYAEKTCGS